MEARSDDAQPFAQTFKDVGQVDGHARLKALRAITEMRLQAEDGFQPFNRNHSPAELGFAHGDRDTCLVGDEAGSIEEELVQIAIDDFAQLASVRQQIAIPPMSRAVRISAFRACMNSGTKSQRLAGMIVLWL